MKYLKAFLLSSLLFPLSAFATSTIPWLTVSNVEIFPGRINGTVPAVAVGNSNTTTINYAGLGPLTAAFTANGVLNGGIFRYASNNAIGPTISLVKTRGTEDAQTAISSGDVLGNLYFGGTYSGNASYYTARITAGAEEDATDQDFASNMAFWTDNGTTIAEKMRIEGGGDVGIGTTSPYAKLSVTNTTANPSFIVEDDTSPDGTQFTVDASGNVGVATSSPYKVFAVAGDMVVDNMVSGTNAFSLIGQRPTVFGTPLATDGLVVGRVVTGGGTRALLVQAETSAAGAGTAIQGINAFVVADANTTGTFTSVTAGGSFKNRYSVQNLGAATLNLATAVSALVNNGLSTASIVDSAAFHAESPTVASGATVTTHSGLWVRGGAVSGTLTTRYGVRIADLLGGTTRYAISQEGASDLNYFAGKVGIASTTPQSFLTIGGNGTSLGGIAFDIQPNAGEKIWRVFNDGNNLVTQVDGNGTGNVLTYETTSGANGFEFDVGVGSLAITGTASSTSNIGWNITDGCYAIDSVCVAGNNAIDGLGTAGMLTSWTDANTITATSGPTFGWFNATSTATSTLTGPIILGGRLAGLAVLSSGSVEVTPGTGIGNKTSFQLSNSLCAANIGTLYISATTSSTFTINSTNILSACPVEWLMYERI